ncbi:MAG: hypothetical protein OXM01_12710 [Gemmatimonadota bacterium]|nr:hypothetical protein [Gemmatimonadota bacterium]
MFALPYVLSGLIHNDDARVEICLEDALTFESANMEAVGILRDEFGGRFLFRDFEVGYDVAPNSVRFLETPHVATEYTYIGDIDILILEPISPLHIERMSESGLPFSNVLRPGGKALTGLHFTRSDAYYPIERPQQGIPLNLDEELLYHLVTCKGYPPPRADLVRPMHGYHLSPNRAPLRRDDAVGGSFHWGLRGAPGYYSAYCALRNHPVWRRAFPFFDRRSQAILGLVELGLYKLGRGFEPNWDEEVKALLHDPSLVNGIVASSEPREWSPPKLEPAEDANNRLRYANALLRGEAQQLKDALALARQRHSLAERIVGLAATLPTSHRWRLGHFLLSLPRLALGRGRPPTAADKLNALCSDFRSIGD